jgi:hypothetical protein
MVIDRLDTVTFAGERVIRRIYTSRDAVLGNRVDTLIDQFDSLRPRSVRSHSSQGTESLDWRDEHVRGTVSGPGNAARGINENLPGAVYSAATVDLILRSSPLAEGYSVRIDAYSGFHSRIEVTARVVGSEVIDGAGDAWRIDAHFGEVMVSFWVAKSSRKLVRQVMHIAPGVELRFELRRQVSAT